ncbi:MAG: molybdopterin molybdotransferase MoeA [Ignavibacteriales bacterium]|nr:molybdopterin molybdotransferase MoeA [Ignavibacteriales bacterium]
MSMISFDEAKRVVLEYVPNLPAESIALFEAHQRVLAKDIVANEDIPPFNNASMDGYALYSDDTVGATATQNVSLTMAGEVAAGEVYPDVLRKQNAIRVMTGAPIPQGADAVLEQELVATQNGYVKITMHVAEGRNIRRKGEDMRKSDIALRKGTVLTSASVGVLASLGITSVHVSRKPGVALLTTGNEIVDVEEKITSGKIRNSNAYTLQGLIKECGCEAIQLGHANDSEEELERKMKEGLAQDVLVTSGGVSVGKYDFVLKTLEKLGVEIKFWKVNIKPGMPIAFGVYSASSRAPVLVFALPGNPVSTMVTFLQFVRPVLHKMMGVDLSQKSLKLRAALEHDIQKHDGKRHFMRGIVRNENGNLIVKTTGSQSSGVLTSLASANCFILLPEERKEFKAGSIVDIELIERTI